MKRFLLMATAALGGMLHAARLPLAADGNFYPVPGFLNQQSQTSNSGVTAAIAVNQEAVTVRMRTALGGETPKVASTAHDSTVMFGGEVMEFALVPRADGVYYQVGVNPDGLCYSAKGRGCSWELPEKPLLVRTPEYWEITVRISLRRWMRSHPGYGGPTFPPPSAAGTSGMT